MQSALVTGVPCAWRHISHILPYRFCQEARHIALLTERDGQRIPRDRERDIFITNGERGHGGGGGGRSPQGA